MQDLLQKIESKNIKVGVIGMGYVGLPLAIEIAKSDIQVVGIDVAESKVDAINSGESYISDVPSEVLADQVRRGRFAAVLDFQVVRTLDAIIICVPTPLNKTKDPDLGMVVEAVDRIIENRRENQLVVLESTTYPGTTEELILPKFQDAGASVGVDFFLAFSPERVDPGNSIYKTSNIPKVIGGVTPPCSEVASKLYSNFIEKIVRVSSSRTAEMVKLLENTFRSVNIGLVNEIALICDRLGVNVWEVIEAAGSKPFGFMPFYPGPGLGGHCIPIDPLYLSWKLKPMNYRARFIELATEINSGMPRYVVNKINDALNESTKAIKNSKVLIIGVSYKKDFDDLREAPALDIIQLLRSRGAEVAFYDPYIPEIRLDSFLLEAVSLDRGLEGVDCTVIITNHSCIDYRKVVEGSPLVIDTRNATKGISNSKIIKL